MNRFDRITAILISLQTRRVITAQQLSERFDISIRTVYRDIRTLEEAGVPIISEAGVGYSLMDGYRLPPVMFTPQEALSFVASEKLMQKFTDQSIGGHYRSAMEKIKSVLRNAEKDMIDKLEKNVQINPQHAAINESLPTTLDILFRSIATQKIVRMHYQAFFSDEPIWREIEPIGVFHENQYWYVIGYCLKRRAYRQFRADRMKDISLTEVAHTRKHRSLDEIRELNRAEHVKTKVVIEIDKATFKYIKERSYYFGLETEVFNGNRVTLTFWTDELELGFARWLLMFGDKVKIIEPERLQNQVKTLVQSIAKNFLIDVDELKALT